MDNLVQNRLFLQYLSGAGGAMSTGQPIGGRLDEITQQNISARSKHKLNQAYIKMMRQILEGGGDIKLGKDTTDIKVPSGMYGGLGSELARSDEGRMDMYPQGSGVGAIAKGLRDEQTVEGIGNKLKDEAYGPQFGEVSTDRSSFLNPSASPLDDITGADLAGLTAGDVSQALSGATNVQALKQRTLTDIADQNFRQKQLRINEAFRQKKLSSDEASSLLDQAFKQKQYESNERYRQQMMEESGARIKQMKEVKALDQPFIGGYTLRQFKALEKGDRAYVAYVHQAKQQGALGTYEESGVGDIAAGLRPDIMSSEEFKAEVPMTTQESYLRSLMDDPEMMAAAKDLKRTEQKPLRRPLVTWTTATNELTKRFGKMDPTGMWAVTPELQAAHDKAQEFLVELKGQGMEPLMAVNEANKRARVWISDRENRYHEYIEAAQGIKNKDERKMKVRQVQDAYLNKYGYIPSVRR